MKTARAIGVAFLLIATTTVIVSAQDEGGKEREPWLRFGPRIGVTGVASTWSDFDENIQMLYPANRDYFPAYSVVGFSLEQSIRLSAERTLVLRELWLRSGYEQSVTFPSLIMTAGFRFSDRFDVFIGPEWTTDFYGGSTDEMPYLLVGVGYIFRPWGARMPVTLTGVPLTEDWKARVTLMAGLDFKLPKLDFSFWKQDKEEDLPFNY